MAAILEVTVIGNLQARYCTYHYENLVHEIFYFIFLRFRAKVEYQSMAHTFSRMMWLHRFHAMNFLIKKFMKMDCDKYIATFITNNSTFLGGLRILS